MTPERKIKNQVKKVLDKLQAYYFFPATVGYGASGVPDVIACYKGKFVGIECKANGNKPTALQQKHLREISINGGTSLVIDETNINMLEFYITGRQIFGKEDNEPTK